MRQKGNALYWDLVAETMKREALSQREAEYALTLYTLKRYHRQGHSTRQIALHLHKVWGLCPMTYYRRLAKARQTICIP